MSKFPKQIQEDEDPTPKSLPTISDTEKSSEKEINESIQQECHSSDVSHSSPASSKKEILDSPSQTSGKLLDRRKSLEPTKIIAKDHQDEVREEIKLGSNLGMLMLRDQNQGLDHLCVNVAENY